MIEGGGSRAAAEHALTAFHADLAEALLAEAGGLAREVALVGFPGHTIRHEPAAGRTDQIGDGAALARRLGIDVVNDFRSNDAREGGQGAPFAPLYHAALAPAGPSRDAARRAQSRRRRQRHLDPAGRATRTCWPSTPAPAVP